MVLQQSAQFPMKRFGFEPQCEDIFPIKLLYQADDLKVQVCIVVYLPTVLMEECILDVVYWFGLQLLGQDVTEF